MTGHSGLPELLAPAGSPEAAAAAVICGADAVYLGGRVFSARANAKNFSDSELAEVVKYCHLRGVKVHRAMNTEIFGGEIKELAKAAEYSAECGIDAFIVSDWGAARIIKRIVPDMPLHASTQMTVHTVKGALEAAERGFSRVVLARELPLDIIAEIARLDCVETEIFVHGALCMCVSGQCYMSAFIGARSANRGQCAQACRLPFNASGISGVERHDLSLKDMSYINRIRELVDTGVTSFKIEGRMKRPEYTAAAVTAFGKAMRGEGFDIKTLEAVFSRSGFTDGYLDRKTGAEMFGFRRKRDVDAAEKVLPALRELYRTEEPRYALDMSFSAEKDVPARLSVKCGDIYTEVTGDVPETAVNRPLTADHAENQLSRSGGTVFYKGSFSADIADNIRLSASSLNGMRRKAVSECERLITAANTPVYKIYDFNEEHGRVPENISSAPKIRIHIRGKEQLEAAEYADSVVLPASECPEDGKYTEKLIAAPPPFTLDEKRDIAQLEKLRERGYDKLYCSNPAHIRIGRELGFKLYGGRRLICVNRYAAAELAEMGLCGISVSIETALRDIAGISGIIEVSAAVYGYIPLMLARNCPIRQAAGCKKCKGTVTDRTGRRFGVKCFQNKEYIEIYNCDILYMTDKLDEIKGADCFDYIFQNESPAEIKAVLNGKKPSVSYTRGLYCRKQKARRVSD